MNNTTNHAFAEAPRGHVVMVRACTRSGRSSSFFVVTEDGAYAWHHARRPSRGRMRSTARRLMAGREGAL